MKNEIPLKAERSKNIEEILKGEYPDEAKASVGENRGQLFIRIPQKISRRLGIKKNDTLIFRIATIHEKNIVQLEVE